MGCNTSKESVQPAAEEAKEDVKNGDIPKVNDTENSTKETKSEETSKEDKSEVKKEENSEKLEEKEEEEVEEDVSDQHKVEAATRIQAAFRGHHARKSMKETDTSKQQTGTNKSESEPTKEELQQEFRADDKELCNAATKIQASFRGHMSRKEQAAAALVKSAGEIVENAASKIEKKVEDAVNELEGIDLTDPDLHKAATKIQASFRGHKVRQEVSVAPNTEAEDKK
ncbi:neurofilament medium polypeptide-like [Vespa mandarinia]|uniref:neurofilament medium polypeptide-like n=1 Tax=Vespa mandarinia TaxID=7446 RepID=UPI00160BA2A5|nr:neurofilament medium polypeptide-like [Vespa mandarinia]XP_047363650.1 neurofilament medium polypeptide [Vespa velutina]